MVLIGSVDYATTYFEFPTVDKIHGEPSYNSIKTIKRQLKTNAQTVPSTLGAGNHGLLGLVLTPEEYARVSMVPFVEPARPRPLQIPPFTAQHDVIRLQGLHTQRMDTYTDCQAVKKALLRQIVTAVDAAYIKELRDPYTNTIDLPVHGVLAHLFNRYGQVTSEQLDLEESNIANFFWDLNDPPALMFNKIEDLRALAQAAHVPKTDAQLVNLGLGLVKKTKDFESALLAWYNLDPNVRTYENFKTHFVTAQTELKKVRGATMRSTNFHQANQVTQLQAELNQMRDEIVTGMNTLAAAHQADMDEIIAHPTPPVPPVAQANATTDVNAEVLQVLRMMQSQMANWNSPNNHQDGRDRNRVQGQRNGGRGTGTPRFRARRNINHYCWTHGACAHDGSQCTNTNTGHKRDATFEDKKGGSTYYCDN